jgi:LuxR family quorum sensing-dependent transcriptional regulator
MNYRNLAFDAIEQLALSTSAQQVTDTLSVAFAKLEYSSVAVLGLPSSEKAAGPLILAGRPPNGWLDTYREEGFYLADHIIAHARAVFELFELSEAPYDRHKAPEAERLMQALTSFGIGKGFMVPIGRPINMPVCIALAGENPDLQPAAKRAAEMIVCYALGKMRVFLRPSKSRDSRERLTQREREVLQWTAVGKTSWEIGVMLGVREQLINKIISGAMIKLDAVTRTQAVVTAIRDRDIEL